jgi:hypothetical protein
MVFLWQKDIEVLLAYKLGNFYTDSHRTDQRCYKKIFAAELDVVDIEQDRQYITILTASIARRIAAL